MPKPKCDKIKEIAEIQTDAKWIKKNVGDMDTKIDNIHTLLTEGKGKISVLNNSVFGTEADPGLLQRTRDIEGFINEMKGAMKLIKFAIGIGAINLLGFLFIILKEIIVAIK